MSNTTYNSYYRNSWALVIGINNYEFVSPLSYACNDADAVADALATELGFPKDHIALLKDRNATKQAILDTFLAYSDMAGDPDDRVLVFFAGHGTTFDGLRGPVGYLIPVEGNLDNKNSLVRWSDLTRDADLIPAKHILFIMDACYSGLATQRAITPGANRFVSDMLQRVARQVITAGKADQTVADGGGPLGKNSIFTGYLVKGLRGDAADKNGILTANGLMHYVYEKVGQDNRSKQTPHYGNLDGDGDFILRMPNNKHLQEISQEDYLVEAQTDNSQDPSITEIPTSQLTYVFANGYGNPQQVTFGRNEWSGKLGEIRRGIGITDEISRAYSWLSIIIEPVSNQAISLDIHSESGKLANYLPVSDKPFERFAIPKQFRTTINSVIAYEDMHADSKYWRRFIRIDRQGNIEYADSDYVFLDFQGARTFRYVQVIGTLWQFLYFSKKLLASYGYTSGVRLTINLVGTKDTILSDFSESPGEENKHWTSPFGGIVGFNSLDSSSLACTDPNLQLVYRFLLNSLNEPEVENTINDTAIQLGLAYNHQTPPRCFNYGTGIFPWQQFFNGRRY